MMKKISFLLCLVLITSNMVSCSSISSDSSESAHQGSEQNNSDEKQDDIVLTFAMSGDSGNIEETIKQFNAADNGYQVQIKRYSEQFNEDGSINVLKYHSHIEVFSLLI